MTDRFEPGGTELPVVVDHKTGLMWQKNPVIERIRWFWAVNYAERLSLLFHGDWRLPNVQELVSIVDYGRHGPAIDREAFPQTPPSWFWTSSLFVGQLPSTPKAWCVNFIDGSVNFINLDDDAVHIRCVRGGNGND